MMMSKCGEIRRHRRFAGWDYSKGASLFITIATAPRRPVFGRIVNGSVVLSPLGEKVKESLESMPRLNPGISLFGHVVMPDHVHFNCAIWAGLDEPLKVMGGAIRRFKNYTTALAKRSLAINAMRHNGDSEANRNDGRAALGQAGGSNAAGVGCAALGPEGASAAVRNDGRTVFGQLWQQGYHDYLLLSSDMISATERYIAYNPQKWELMYGEAGALRVTEPVFSPRLDAGDYWKGVGNLKLLDPAEKLLSLRISREVQGAEMERMLERIGNAVSQGYIVISGFISKGEQAVRDMLCRRKDARFIRILPSCIPNRRFRPESRYVAPFAEGRYLEIAKGNDETDFGRPACLDLNAEIIEIAKAGEGLSLYWKADGPKVLTRGQCDLPESVRAVDGVIPEDVDVEQEFRNHVIEKYLES